MNLSLFLLFLGIAGIVAYFAYLAEKRRTTALTALAFKLGAAPIDSVPLPTQALNGLQLWNRGRRRKAKNILCFQKQGKREFLFDYQYTVGSGKHSHTHKQSVFLLENTRLPSFQLRPEGFLDRVGEIVGFTDIDFEENKEFSKLYSLKGQDQAAIRVTFSAQVLQALVRHSGLTAECSAGTLVIYRSRQIASPEKLEIFLRDMREAASCLGCNKL